MTAYLKNVKDLIRLFSLFIIEVIPRVRNSYADALTKLASTKDVELLNVVSMEFLPKPSINQRQVVMELDQEPSWMDLILTYLKIGELLDDKIEAKVLRVKDAHNVVYDDNCIGGATQCRY